MFNGQYVRNSASFAEEQRILRLLHHRIDEVIEKGSKNVNSLTILQDLRRDILEIPPAEKRVG